MSGAAKVQVKNPISCALLRIRSLPWPASGTAGKEGKERLSSPWPIITTSANELMQPIHDRMPVVLEKDDLVEWLAPQTELKLALAMLGPYPPEKMVAYPVNSVVNNARQDGPECDAKVNVDEPPY